MATVDFLVFFPEKISQESLQFLSHVARAGGSTTHQLPANYLGLQLTSTVDLNQQVPTYKSCQEKICMKIHIFIPLILRKVLKMILKC